MRLRGDEKTLDNCPMCGKNHRKITLMIQNDQLVFLIPKILRIKNSSATFALQFYTKNDFYDFWYLLKSLNKNIFFAQKMLVNAEKTQFFTPKLFFK